eukprot:2572222-Prymnesium_polylepis.1
MNEPTRSHTESSVPRLTSSASSQNVFMNHSRLHRSGSPLRTAGSSLDARCHSSSIFLRCAVRKRHPIDDPLRARSSYTDRFICTSAGCGVSRGPRCTCSRDPRRVTCDEGLAAVA